ncbi:MAG: TolC family protein [Lachnospiraceae bacterium]|nr:TolC family protein [Lachnospiraceae bacterium]
MLKDVKMRKSKYVFIYSIALVFIITFNSFAELGKVEYFNGLTPQTHVNKLYSDERKNELKQDIVNYSDIEDMIHLFNPEILNNWNSWENDKSAEDIYDIYQSAADRLFDSAGTQDSMMQEDMMSAQGRAMQIQADKNVSDSYINFLSNYLAEKQLVLTTKILDINYQKSAYELLNANEAIKESERNLTKAENALKYGSGTQVELLTAKKAVADAKSSLIAAESAQKANKIKLILNCGKSASDNIYITPIDLSLDIDINAINLTADFETAKNNNIQLEIYKRKIDNARTEEVKNEFTILYEAAPDKIYNDLENKYRSILDAVDTNANRQVALTLANDNLKKAKDEYEHGNISVKEFLTVEYNLAVANNNVLAAQYDLKLAVENYKNILDGYSNC